MNKDINIMVDEVLSPPLNKQDIKPLAKKRNVISIASLSDLSSFAVEIQSQITAVLDKLNDEVSPEFKALMEGYVNKANETEELKVNLENISSKCEELKAEINQIRSTNRNLVHELQNAREVLTKLEGEVESLQAASRKSDAEYKDKVRHLNKQVEDYEIKLKAMEEKYNTLQEGQEKFRQEQLEQNFRFRTNEQDLINQRDNLKKQLEEFEILLGEQREQLELKTKEAEYKDALLNQFIKQTTNEKLTLQSLEGDSLGDELKKKKRFIFF